MLVSPTVNFRSKYGLFYLNSFEFSPSETHVAMWMGDLTSDESILLRVQSACLTSTALGGIICDCAEQMRLSLETISSEGRGLFLYLDEEGRGYGLHEKVICMSEVNKGEDTVTSLTKRGFVPDVRTYSRVSSILAELKVTTNIRLMTNNPNKIQYLESQGYNIVARVPTEIPPTELTRRYLLAKKNGLGHILTGV